MFKWYKSRIEKEIVKSLKFLRFDRDGEFMFIEFPQFCVENGSKRKLSSLRTPK